MNREVEKIRKEIERRKKEYCNGFDAVTELYNSLLSFIDSLQEEPASEGLDLDKEIETHLKECLDIKFPTTDIELIAKDVEHTARKFFELGLKSRKENKL